MTRYDTDRSSAIALTRFGLGARPGELDAARRDARGWLVAQIDPRGADIPTGLAGAPLPTSQSRFQDFLAFRDSAKMAKVDQDMAARKAAAMTLNDETGQEILARAQLAATTPAGFRERWALFWSNHFSVSMAKGEQLGAVAPAFEREAIRPHVFGRFGDMLLASTRHPAMLMYLDQERSLGPDSPAGQRRGARSGLNENLGREVLELHTLGADAGYTQADVTEFARALTGWSMGGRDAPPEQQGVFLYRAQLHEPGPRTVFGRIYPDTGQGQAETILADLARDPHTAQHLSHQIAAHFVADDPPPSLVARLKGAYLHSGGDLSVVARTLVEAPEAWSPEPRKFKTPYEFVLSSYRAAGAQPSDMRKDVIGPLTALGHRPFSAPQPNGWSDVAADWAAPDAIVRRLGWAQGFAASRTPQAEPVRVADQALGVRLGPEARQAVARAETRQQAFAILLMSPEFQRR